MTCFEEYTKEHKITSKMLFFIAEMRKRSSTYTLFTRDSSNVNPFTVGNLLFWENFLCQNAFETVLFEGEQSLFLQLTTRVSQLWPVTAMRCGDPTWNDPNFGSPKIAPKAECTTYMSKLDIVAISVKLTDSP